jgi:queuine tRNA-ribosyltransferase
MIPTKNNSAISIKNIKNGVRIGTLSTRAGTVKTPFFMAVGTRGAVKGLTPEQVASTGVQTILGNTYHLHLAPGEKAVKKLGGIHQFIQWPGPILTDSGGFQVFSLAHTSKITEEGVSFKDPKNGDLITLTPEKAIQIQLDLSSDIIMAFDDVAGLDGVSLGRRKEAYERTHRWLERSLNAFKKGTKGMKVSQRPLFFGIAQGGLDRNLRQKSIEFVQSLDVDGLAVGGLSVGESRNEMYKLLKHISQFYDPNLPHYLMGVGDPKDMRVAIENGIDMFDCVLPTRNGRHGTAWISGDKTIQLGNSGHKHDADVIDPGCDCYTCKKGYSRGFIRHQFKSGDSLAGTLVSIHNIRYLERLCEEYR